MIILAEILPDPNGIQSIGWSVLVLAGLIVIARNVIGFWRDLRGEDPVPPNTQLGQSLVELGRRVNVLEDWKELLTTKLEADKTEILKAGEDRSSKIHSHIESERRAMDRKIEFMPDRIITMLRNAGVIK